jgi:hypothetical protein
MRTVFCSECRNISNPCQCRARTHSSVLCCSSPDAICEFRIRVQLPRRFPRIISRNDPIVPYSAFQAPPLGPRLSLPGPFQTVLPAQSMKPTSLTGLVGHTSAHLCTPLHTDPNWQTSTACTSGGKALRPAQLLIQWVP